MKALAQLPTEEMTDEATIPQGPRGTMMHDVSCGPEAGEEIEITIVFVRVNQPQNIC